MSLRRNRHAGDFAVCTFRAHFKRAAADFAIRRETLVRDRGVNRHVKRLAAERALDAGEFFHAGNLDRPRQTATAFHLFFIR
jgi:hypothetical protein